VRLIQPASPNGHAPNEPLTGRQKDVLARLARGLSNKEIAYEVHITPKMVDHHRATLMARLDIHDVAGLTRYAVKNGMLNLEGLSA